MPYSSATQRGRGRPSHQGFQKSISCEDQGRTSSGSGGENRVGCIWEAIEENQA